MTRSRELYQRATSLLPGGVNSPVRAFNAVGGTPRFMATAEGATLVDVDGRRYLDYVGSWGPMILGHRHPVVLEAMARQMERGMSFGMPTELEVEMAALLVDSVPALEMVRMVNSGTEATMSAIRVARTATGRELIVKFEGCYHGHGDAFLSQAGSGAATLGIPSSPGVPKGAAAATLNGTYNDSEGLERLFDLHQGQIAGVILEPVVGNMGCVPPRADFLRRVRELCTRHGSVLIFDEVMTGFRVAFGGAQSLLGVTPDLVTLGKVIGAGLPVGAYGGRRDLMELVAPAGPMYQAGTLSGNPLGMAAGLAQLRFLRDHPEVYDKLERDGAALESGIRDHILKRGHPACVQRVGSMGTVFFHPGPVDSWHQARECDTARFATYFNHLLEAGIHMPAAQFEAWFHSAAHTEDDIARTVEAVRAGLDTAFA